MKNLDFSCKFVTGCTRQYTQSRSPPPAYRPARAAATPTTLCLPPPCADRYKGKAGEPRKGSSPGAASRVTPERRGRTGRTTRRCLSWWVLPQEGISSTLRLPGGAGPSTDEWVLPWSAFDMGWESASGAPDWPWARHPW